MERRDEPPARCLGLGWPRGSPVTPQPSDAGLVQRPRLCVPRGRQVAPHRAPIAVPSSLRRRERLASRRGRSCPLLKLEPSVYPFPTSPDGRTIDSPRILCVVSHPVRVAVTAALLCLPPMGERQTTTQTHAALDGQVSRWRAERHGHKRAAPGYVRGVGEAWVAAVTVTVRPGSLAGRGQSGAPPLASCQPRPLVTSPPLPVL